VSGVQLGVGDRTVVVAGAGGDGIGTGVSALLVRSGATVLGLDVDRDALALTGRWLHGRGGVDPRVGE